MPGDQIRLLALDGGGVRGLSSLMILDGLMATVDPESPPKPCEYFDMIGGTSTGGLIAVMLGRLRMTVDECIEAYTSLSDKVFEKKSHRVKINGKLQGRFDAAKLEDTIKEILRARNLDEDELLKDVAASCKVFVCAMSKQTSDTVCLASYRSPRTKNPYLLNSATIWQACRATSAATGFFDPIVIGPFGEEFVDDLATETERTAQQFQRNKSDLYDEGRYFRFNVNQGLQEIGLEESKKKKEIAAATVRYIESQTVFKQMQASELEQCLLPRRLQFRHEQRRKIFVLHGLGGVGKTQLAANFARRYQATFSSVFWLDGRSEDRLRQSLAGSDVLDWLARPDNVDWLLIFDNVDQDHEQGGTTSVFDIRRYLPGDHGSILITTTLLQLAQLGNPKHAKKLKKVDDNLSKAIFEQWYGGELVLDTAGRELLRLLDGLPLALAQAAAYCRETGLDIASYVRLYNQQWGDLMAPDTEPGSPLIDYDQQRVGTTWTISLKAIETRSKSAANLLRLWAFIANKDLWYGLLQAAAVSQEDEQWPEWLREIAENQAKFLNTVRLLLRYSMIEVQESEQGSYNLHPSLASLYRDQGRLPEAEAMYQRALQGYEKALGSDHTSTLDMVNNLGVLYRDQGRLPEAEAMFQRALQGKEKALGPDHASALATVNNLGNLYCDQGRLPEAEAMFLRALQGKEKALGPDHTSTLNTVGNLGSLYRDQGRLLEAEAMHQRALQGCEKALGPDHTSTLDTVNNLGVLYRDQGRLQEAEAMFQRALQGKEKALGPDHTSTLDTVNNLGVLYRDQGQLQEAEAMYQRALQGKEKALGPDHTSTLVMVGNLGVLYRDQGRLPEAEAMYQRALQGYEKALGPDHTSTLTTVNNLGNLYKA
ncbi:hypothetical protein Sste5346_006436 [Sporothrix stenoceras]|uniref:PNPLA domain-containing protein n=1 Tax=Sporothrix stenoceras TaxID=5173 RepID=A0ABR3YYY4_9PEZI